MKGRRFSTRNVTSLSLTDHMSFWIEAKNENPHYFIQSINMTEANINKFLEFNSKYSYDLSDTSAIKNLYTEFCSSLVLVRQNFNYELIGKTLEFLISDTRFHLKPFDISKSIIIIYDSYLNLLKEWDKIVLDSFPFAYKTLLSGRYEVKSLLLYLALEGCAHKIVSPTSSLLITDILGSFLHCLELPMSLYFDSYYLRKLLFKMGHEKAPAYSLQCLHPILTQLQYIFLNYFTAVENGLLDIDILKDVPWTMKGFNYLLQGFLVDHYHEMIYWKTTDYKMHLENEIIPVIMSMTGTEMPFNIINKLLIQGFYDIIEADCKYNFVKTQYNSILKDINNWHYLVKLWNDGIDFNEFKTSNCENKHGINLLIIFFYLTVETKSIIDAKKCIRVIHKFILKRIKTAQHLEIVLKYLSIYPWNFEESLHLQIERWINDVLLPESGNSFEDNTLRSSYSLTDEIITNQNN